MPPSPRYLRPMLARHALYEPTQHNLRRIVGLRTISIGMQALLITVGVQWLALPLPVLPLVLILVAQGGWNLFTAWRARQPHPISDAMFFFQLLTDVLAFTAILYCAGGATNPFAWFYLLPLMIAATLLPTAYVWGMAGLTVTCYSLLLFFYLPLHGPQGLASPLLHDAGFSQHVFGMWFGFVFSAVLVSYFVTTMAQTLRARDRILSEAREQILRDERLVSLGTLAAGAAHELGTPLGTIALVVDDLLLDFPDTSAQEKTPGSDSPLRHQLELIRGQIDRCKNTLSVISASAGTVQADAGQGIAVDTYLQSLVERWQHERPANELHQQFSGTQPAPLILADLALTQALTNVFNNAADASPERVELHAQWNETRVEIQILDRGPGLSPAAASAAGKSPFSNKPQGLGVGLFLAHAVIERLGGQIVHQKRASGGTCTRIQLPLITDRRENDA